MDRPTTDNVTKHVIPTADEFIRKLSPLGTCLAVATFQEGRFSGDAQVRLLWRRRADNNH